jgi:hypothetical protein
VVAPADLSVGQVLESFRGAIDCLRLNTPVDQASTKAAVVVTLDRLIGIVYGKEQPLPWLYANRTEFNEADGFLGFTRHYPQESILDVAVYRSETAPYMTLATAESEAWAQHEATTTSTSDTSNYLWDLYKLLQVVSPLRLFVARVTGTERCSILEERIAWLVGVYAKDLRHGDSVFSLVLPTAGNAFARLRCCGWRREGERLKELQ